MKARPLLLSAAIPLVACSCSVLKPSAPPRTPGAADFEAAIARIERSEPASPAVLSAHLEYADFLLERAPGPCGERLVRAQEEIGSVSANPETPVMLPEGVARAADLEYRLHLGRVACGAQADRRDELLAAASAALHAAELYRNVFDYRSMALLQFDASRVLHELGENSAALQALDGALDMDREYGFRDAAAQSYRLLLALRGETAGPAQLAHLMQDFPRRRATLRFGWRAGDARMTLEMRRECIEDGAIVGSRAAASYERRISADPGGSLSVSYSHRLARYEPGVWPTGSLQPRLVFPPAPLAAAAFEVSGTGEFESATDSKAFAARLIAKTEGLIRARAPSGERARLLTDDALGMTEDAFSPGMLEAEAAESYALETAMWIGATLEQGVWYELSAPLSLPGIPRLVIQHRIEFAFTRRVPCTARAAAPACVEIVVRAIPDRKALERVSADLSGMRSLDYAGSLEARIVTDPATLLAYAREERLAWYVVLARGKGFFESQHLVSIASYPPRSNPPRS
jgi:hypothetical protein